MTYGSRSGRFPGLGFAAGGARLLPFHRDQNNEKSGFHVAYLLADDEQAGPAVRRVFREQNARILALLRSWENDPADAIHRARQTCKKARALAQLLRPAQPYVARVENSFFRGVQRGVAYARDPEALVEALDFLEIGVAETRLAESVAMLRESLALRAVRGLDTVRPALRMQAASACRDLEAADRRLAHLPITDLRRRDLKRGAGRTWDRCAAIYAGLVSSATPTAFHDWRRQVKYAFHQVQLLSAWQPQRASTLGPRLRELAALLGHGQDLELLEALLRQQPDALGIDTHVQRLRQLIGISLERLRQQSLVAGADLFGAGAGAGQAGPPESVTQAKQNGKDPATGPAEDRASTGRRVTPDRDPNIARRWQSR